MLEQSQQPRQRTVNLSYLKEHLSLSKVAAELDEYLLPAGTQTCIFCQRSGKLTTREDRFFKCYHPACAKKGTVVDLVIEKGLAANPKDAFRVLIKFLDGESKSKIERMETFESKRAELLAAAMAAYERGLEGEDEILELLNERGYCKVLEERVPVGFARGDNFLREEGGMSTEDLELLGLISSSSGNEFFRNRIIFPIRNNWGKLVHLQGRAIDSSEKLRWLSTPSGETAIAQPEWRPRPISEFIFEIHKLEAGSTAFLTEGVSDCLTLLELDLNAVACFGVEVNLARHAASFSKLNKLIAFLDNDVYPLGSQFPGEYKSWRAMLPNLIDLQEACPNLEIWCVMPPNRSGIKDINDWVRSGQLDAHKVLQYVKERARQLEDFALNMWGKDLKRHYDLLRLIAIKKSPYHIERLKREVETLQGDSFDWLQYCLRVTGLA